MSYGQPPNGPQGYGQQPGGPQYQPPRPMSPEDQRLWATLTHIGGIFFNFIVPLVAYVVLRDRGQFVREHTRQALNFHITVAIASFVSGLLTVVLIGFVLLPVIGVLVVVFAIMAAVAANQGRFYQYPLTFQFIKA
ncbi:hypothetical protein ASG04_13760 [Curtobacterium sp. Leaf183]|uniref:DUF4870 domain-containing protein n=1 Tax=Curtobacterium sp. Leaf183 TaxID=1736291 RepID=UPI0007013DA6|nr:DUF4870 domain-containing protein [Curtobacterium sp. Leaf183]KQS08182.1 hypothetical protein ASG04_13760 [Curtobacterium sp. Leaf183]